MHTNQQLEITRRMFLLSKGICASIQFNVSRKVVLEPFPRQSNTAKFNKKQTCDTNLFCTNKCLHSSSDYFIRSPFKYCETLNCRLTCTIFSSNHRHYKTRSSDFLKASAAYAIGRSSSFCNKDNTAATQVVLGSINSMNGRSNLGNACTGPSQRTCFRVS